MSVAFIVDKTSHVLEFNITLDGKYKLICNMFLWCVGLRSESEPAAQTIRTNTSRFLVYKILLEIFRLTVLSAVSTGSMQQLKKINSL